MVKKALLIGINYKGSKLELNGCINDVKNIKDILLNNFGYNDENIRILTEETNLIPNKMTIERSIKWLVTDCKPGDTLYLHYSGHGASIQDTSGDESDGKDEVIIPLDYRTSGVITDDWVNLILIKNVPIGVKLWVFMDCCHSGTLMDLKYNWQSLSKVKDNVKSLRPYKSEDWTTEYAFSYEKENDIGSNAFICMFSGCQDSQVSLDANISGNYSGAFTYCFIEFIKNNLIRTPDGKTNFRNGEITLGSVLKEINSRLQINGFQIQSSQMSLNNLIDFESKFSL